MSRKQHALMLIKPPGSAKLRFVAREERPPNRRAFRRYIEVGEGSADGSTFLTFHADVLSTGNCQLTKSTDETR